MIMIQDVIVYLLIAAAVAFVVYRAVRRYRHRNDAHCDCGCGCGQSCANCGKNEMKNS